MAKIRLKKLPDGFEIKNGKVTKKMKHGGMMTGDQSGYGLVTSPYNFGNDQFNNTNDVDVRYSLSSVPREVANIEAEGGETVLTDLNNDGRFGLYDIKGPRHSSGGVPMYLPEQSFVFSDTAKMKFNRQELAEFGIESRKKMTPAKVSKKYQLNEYIGAMADPFADNITTKSAELMIDKNQMSLSKLAFGQEAKKQFSDGVPATAHPYLISQGINPIEFTQKVENITREQAAQRMFEGLSPEQQAQVMALRQIMEQAGQMSQPMAAYGMELPRAQNGIEYQKMSNGRYGIPFTADAQEGVYYFNPANGTAYQFTNGKYVEIGKHAVDTEGNPVGSLIPTGNPHAGTQYNTTMENAGWVWSGDAQAYVKASGPLDPTPPATTIPATTISGSAAGASAPPSPTPSPAAAPAAAPAASRRGGRTTLDVSEIEGGRGLGDNYSQYQELERLFTSGDPMWETTIDRAYVAFVANAKAQGIPESDIPSKAEMVQTFLDYQKNNYMIADLMPEDMRYAKELDRGRGDRKNKNTQALFDRAAELYPDLYGGYNIDDKTTQLNQLFFQAVTIADKDNAEPYLSYTATGPNQNTNWAVNKKISKKDGFYGNNTLNQFLQVAEPEPEKEKEEEGCLCPDGTYSLECCDEPGDIQTYRDPDLDFYTQDLYKGAAIALRDRNMYMPFRQPIERPRIDYVLEEPTRQLADVNEKYNIAAQAVGAFAGPQSTSARLSKMSGDAMTQAANAFARVHGRNINTVNSGLTRQAQLDFAVNRLNAERTDQLYDATQATLQMYDNEKNADMNDFMNWQADALTNAVGAYNLSSLYDQFNINPVTGGTIDFVNGRRPIPSKQGDPRVAKQQRMQDLQDLYNMFGEDGVNKAMIDYYTSGTTQAENPMLSGNYAEMYGLTPEVLATMSLANGQGKKGKEIKKFAVPFYTGKMGS